MKILLTTLLLLNLISNTYGEIVRDWVAVSDEKNTVTTYLDVNSIVYFQKEIVQAQYMVNLGLKPQTPVRRGKSTVSTIEVDCNSKTKYRVLSNLWFEENFSKGKYFEEKKSDSVWHYPPHETSARVVIKSLCQ